jgi:hypothetical protein
MFQVKRLHPNKYKLWDEFVESHEFGTIYHTSLWLKLISFTYDFEGYHLVIENDNGEFIAGLPLFIVKSKIMENRLSTIPGAQACNPLVSNQEEYMAFMNYISEVLKKENITNYELKTSNSQDPKIQYEGTEVNAYSTYLLDLNNPLETIRKSFHKSSVQRAINKSLRSNLELTVARSLDDVKSFYQLYFQMRKDNGLLPQPYKFFKNMWELLSERNQIDILFANHHQKIISTILLVKYKDTVVYEYGASIPEMMNLRPSQFLLWHGIQKSKEQGYKSFDFGRVTNDNESLVQFKERWGTQKRELPYYYLPALNGGSPLRQSKMLKNIMYFTVKSAPKSLCEYLGKTFYRNFS